MKTFQKNKICMGLVSALALSQLVACGGGESVGVKESQVEVTLTDPQISVEAKNYSVTAIDGYLDDAIVCLDVNENFDCDESAEPFANKGTGNGQYSLDVTSLDGNPEDYNLIVKVVKGVTIDVDQGVPAEQDYLLTAPKGINIVSPLSTLVELEVRAGSTLAEAEAALKNKLNLTDTDSLFVDFIKHENADLHAIAASLVQAKLMPENSAELAVLPQEKEVAQSDKIIAIAAAIESLKNDEDGYFTMQSCLDSLPDKGFKQQPGDVWEWQEQRDRWFDGEGNNISVMVVSELKGNDFSWLTGFDSLHAKAPWIMEKENQLTWIQQTLIGPDFASVLNHYSDENYYYGHEEFQANELVDAQENAAVLGSLSANYGYVKLKPSTYNANNTLIINIPRESNFVNTTMGNIQLHQKDSNNDILENSFASTITFVGKETVSTQLGDLETCKIESPYKGSLNGVDQDALQVSWKTNRGTIKYTLVEPGFVYSSERLVTLLPNYPR